MIETYKEGHFLSDVMTSYDDKEQELQCVLAEKERIIDDLQADNEMYKAVVKNFIQQLKQEELSVKQQLDDNGDGEIASKR